MAAISWTGGGTDTSWFTPANWSTNTVPTSSDDVTIPVVTTAYPIVATDAAVAKTLTIADGASMTVSSGSLTITNALQEDGNLSITGGTVQAGIFNGNPSGLIAIGSGLTLTTGGGGANGTVDATISGQGGLTKIGGDVLDLRAVDTYTGSTLVQGGSLRVDSGGSLASTDYVLSNGSSFVIFSSATIPNTSKFSGSGNFTVNGNVEIGSLRGSVNVLAGVSSTLTTGRNNLDDSYSGIIADDITLVKAGTGTFTLNSSSTYTGTTTISAGTLNIRDGTALGTTAAGTTVANGATLQIQGGITTAEALTLSGTGSPQNNGALQNVSGANTISGAITLAASSRINSDSGTLTLTGGINGGAASRDLTLGGAGNGAVTTTAIGSNVQNVNKDGAGTWTLSGPNTYTGGTTISAGTLVAAPGSLGSGAVTINGGTLSNTGNINSSQTLSNAIGVGSSGGTISAQGLEFELGGAITGSGALALSGGALRLSGDNSAFSGSTTLQGNVTVTATGTDANALSSLSSYRIAQGSRLNIGGRSRVIGSLGDVNGSGGFLDNASSDPADVSVGSDGTSTTFSGVIQNRGSDLALIKVGSGTLTLNGTNTYTGATTISAGTLQIGDASATGQLGQSTGSTPTYSNAAVISGATLAFKRSNAYTYGGVISGAGTVTQIGAGTTTLTGANSTNNGQFTGTANVTAGTLAVNGTFGDTATRSATVNIGDGTNAGSGTLHGTGAVAGAVFLLSGGTISAGNSVGTLATGNLSLASGSTLVEEIASASSADRVNVTGTVTIADGAVLDLEALGNLGSTAGQRVVLVANDGTDSVTGRFTQLRINGGTAATIASDDTFQAGGRTYQISYTSNVDGTGANDITVSDVTPAPPPPPDPTPPGPTSGDDNLTGTGGPDQIALGFGNDTYSGGYGADLAYGNQGSDLIYGNQDADTVYGGMGDDRAYGGQGDDRLFGNMGNDVVYGNLGADIVYGNQGTDALYGGQGNDVLYGGMGNDTLIGGMGDDTLVGGLGADRYVFDLNSGRDLVTGFSQSDGDRIALGGQTYTLTQAANGDALLTLSGGGVIDLAGIAPGQVNASYFA